MAKLIHLKFKNFLLFDNLELDFFTGFHVLTGESGSGKSLFLEGLGLLFGARADNSLLFGDKKAILEAEFEINQNDELEILFRELELDFEKHLIIRREIALGGKNRCFVNDTPVNLHALKQIGDIISEIFSQHDTKLIKEKKYQIDLLDQYSGTLGVRKEFARILKELKYLQNKETEIIEQISLAQKEHSFNDFVLNELLEANLKDINEEVELDEKYQELSNANEIINLCNETSYKLALDELSIENQINQVLQQLKSLSSLSVQFSDEYERLYSTSIEIKELANDLKRKSERISNDPQQLEKVSNRLAQLQQLKKKHSVASVTELIQIREELDLKVNRYSNFDSELKKIQKNISETHSKLIKIAKELSELRQGKASKLSKQIISLLTDLEIPHAQFEIQLQDLPEEKWNSNGNQAITFYFSANPGMEKQPIEQVASGGELSRLMLSFKSIVKDDSRLVVFDEIDTGVSGEVAQKIGVMMRKLSDSGQLLVITHLPQVASKAQYHYVIEKIQKSNSSGSNMNLLNKEGRVQEIGRLLSGKNPGEKALKNAEELLNFS